MFTKGKKLKTMIGETDKGFQVIWTYDGDFNKAVRQGNAKTFKNYNDADTFAQVKEYEDVAKRKQVSRKEMARISRRTPRISRPTPRISKKMPRLR